ncbi:unnamed protein product, partial [Ceutorhynchus assimilis]
RGKKPDDKCLKKSNILVFQQPSGKKTERKHGACEKKMPIPICMPKPKPIHICTGAELRKMCPPPACPRPRASPFASQLGPMKFLGFGLKAAVAAALVYVTYDMGVWGGSDDAQQFYSDACALFGQPKPRRSDKWDPPSCEAEKDLFPSKPRHGAFDYCDDPPIKVDDGYWKLQSTWNCAVMHVFRALAGFPGNLMSSKPINK